MVEYTPQALRPEVYINWSRTYVLDQYALQALRPEVQKEKLNSTTTGGCGGVYTSGLTAWGVYKLVQDLRPGPVCTSGLTAWSAKRKLLHVDQDEVLVHLLHLRPTAWDAVYYTHFFFWKKKKCGQKEKARGIWAVRPRFHFCPSGKTIEINLCVLDSRWYTWDSGGFRWYKLQTKCILAWKWTISIGNLRLGPVKFRWSSHQCTMWFHNENRHQLVYLLVEKCSKGWIDWLIQDWLVVV